MPCGFKSPLMDLAKSLLELMMVPSNSLIDRLSFSLVIDSWKCPAADVMFSYRGVRIFAG